MRSAVLRQLSMGQVAQRLLRGCGLCPEPRVLDLTAQHHPGQWVIMWIVPEKMPHGLWGPNKGHSFCAQSFPHKLGAVLALGLTWWGPQLSPHASGFPGSLVKMQILIQQVWDGARSICITNSLPRDAEAADPQTTRSKNVDTQCLGFEEGSPSGPGEVRGGMLGGFIGVWRVAGGK